MQCGICGKELHKGDTAYEGFTGSHWGNYPTRTTVFCSKECAEKNGYISPEEITIQHTDEEWTDKMEKAITALKDIGFTFPYGGFPFDSKDKAVFDEKSADTILIAKLAR